MILRNIISIVLFVVLNVNILSAQIQTHYIPPVLTNPGYNAAEDSSVVSFNPNVAQNRLFLFIGGTWSSSSSDYPSLRLYCASLGFHFISLSYLNDVAAGGLANDPDSMVFNKYRQELCFGTPVSDDVTVDTLNSIYSRTINLLNYLSSAFPGENWGQYLSSPSSLDWSKIAIGGHSQGSGHACYLAKQFSAERVLMFSGPNDYSNTFSNSANWLRQPGITPVNQHFAYLSLLDEVVDFDKQFVNLEGLGMLEFDDTTYIDNQSPPYGSSHFLYTTQTPGLALLYHNTPIMLSQINTAAWEYMLNSPSLSVNALDSEMEFVIFPNPASQSIIVKVPKGLETETAMIFNSHGWLVAKFQVSHQQLIDISSLESDTYFIQIGRFSLQFIKN